jgi:hypothetical protein
MTSEKDTCMSYEEEDTNLSYEEEDTCMSCCWPTNGHDLHTNWRRIHACHDEEDTCMTYIPLGMTYIVYPDLHTCILLLI